MNIFVVGSGKLANAILSIDGCSIEKWDSERINNKEKSIIIHAGSGRQLKECFKFCSETNSILLELSTGLETEKMVPDFPLIICPNTSILVLKTMNMLKKFGDQFKNYTITITESHQKAKKTEAGTAFDFANSLSFKKSEIVSIRNEQIQKSQVGIPEEYLDKHAYHKIIIQDENDSVTIETKVLGHTSYSRGVKAIIEAIVKLNLENRVYSVLELLKDIN